MALNRCRNNKSYTEISSDESDIKPEKSKKRVSIKTENGSYAKKAKTASDVKPKLNISKERIGSKGDTKPDIKPKKKVVKEEPKWKWWEENDNGDNDTKWTFLQHCGPVFAPPYERLPKNVIFSYNGKNVVLSKAAEEVATFYSKMITHDYAEKVTFNSNFFTDWKKVMTDEERLLITDLSKCDFKQMYDYFTALSETRKAMSKEEKNVIKEENIQLMDKYGYCTMDGHTEKIGNFRIEPPGLFRGRGEHPKMGMLKRRVEAEQVIINCSKDSVIPLPPEGHKWKEIRHDNTVGWLACWNENIQGSTKYVMLNANSKLKGQKDWKKYELSRGLHKIISNIRKSYDSDFNHADIKERQRAVATYFIDRLALRAGNEKDDDESADTVGCCSLRVEHLKLHEEWNDKKRVIEFDFLGKDSIRYHNYMSVPKKVYKNVEIFMKNKAPADNLFDRIDTSILNKHLQSFMPGLTAKVFRTYNASLTLSQQLLNQTNANDNTPSLLLSYNRSNRAVAVLCNHQRAVPKNFDKQMENLDQKIEAKQILISETIKEAKNIKKEYQANKTEKSKTLYERKKKAVDKCKEQLNKLTVQRTDRDENKEIALGTSKLNYLDPRITVSWCKKYNVALEKIFNKTQRDKFRWAIEMVEGEEDEFVYVDNLKVE